MVWYYTQPLDPHPLGCIALGSRTFGYDVMKGVPQGVKEDGKLKFQVVLAQSAAYSWIKIITTPTTTGASIEGTLLR